MTALSVRMECAACGNRWEVGPKPDGTMPVGARCPKDRGGCGKVRKVPRAGIASVCLPAVAASGWDPPSEPREVRVTAEPCPHCGEARVYAEPRGTIRVCVGCRKRVTPPGVLAPYERGTEVTRAAKSQRERDLEALDLAERKGVMLGQLHDLTAEDKLTPGSAMKAEWFAEQVKAATTGTRLDELAERFKDAGIRRRHWWHDRPALSAGYDDEDDEDGYDEDDEPDTTVVLATPASIAVQQHRAQLHRMTWAEAIAAFGWRLSPVADGCQIINLGRVCGTWSEHHIGDGWVCGSHHAMLCHVITEHNRRIA